MNNPTFVTVTKGSWVKVATNVTCLGVWVTKTSASYSWTYRVTAGAAPTLLSEGIKLEYPGMQFGASSGFDLYVYCEKEDGALRLDEGFQAEYLVNA